MTNGISSNYSKDLYSSPLTSTQEVDKSGIGAAPILEVGHSDTPNNDSELTEQFYKQDAEEWYEREVDKFFTEMNINISVKDLKECNRKAKNYDKLTPKNQPETPEEAMKRAQRRYTKLVRAVNELLECKAEITARNILDTIGLNRSGVTRAEFEEAKANGSAKSIREELGLSDKEEIDPKSVVSYMKDYVSEILAKVKEGEITTEEAGKLIKKKVALIKYSTDPKDREILIELVRGLRGNSGNNVTAITQIMLCGLEPDAKSRMCKRLGLEIDEITQNNCLTEDSLTELLTLLNSYNTSEELASQNRTNGEEYNQLCEDPEIQEFKRKYPDADEFLKREDIAAIRDKIAKNEELTPEEEAFRKDIEIAEKLIKFPAMAAASMIVVTERGDNKIAKEMDYDNYQLDIYNDIQTNIRDYVATHYEEMGTTVEEFTSKMDAITNGNYSLIAENSDITKSDLNLPHDPNATSNADLGYTAGAGYGDRTRVDYLASQIAPSIEENFEIVRNNDNKPKATQEDTPKNPIKKMAYCIKNIGNKVGNFAKELADTVSRVPSVVITMCLQRTGGEAFDIIRKNADDSAIIATHGKGLTTYQSNLLAEDIDKINEKREQEQIEVV